VTTYATVEGGTAGWQVLEVQSADASGTSALVRGPDGGVREVRAPLPGAFNLANTVGALAALAAAGLDEGAARAALAAAPGVPGRLERVVGPDPRIAAFVDYAHTPDAVERVVGTVRDLTGGRVVVVLGCGGDRDREKRPLMGATAARLADVVIVTDDNPRSEPPEAIRASVLAGARGEAAARAREVREVGDRRQAVHEAVAGAEPGDVVLVLGKGHETGQEVAGTLSPFDDRVVLGEALAAAAGSPA
jgi:UDP-N-acetylmuramoyl-L-alanyl-D-glutamate--2,6-diaminopimelate ligase